MNETNPFPDSTTATKPKRNWLIYGGLGCGGLVVICFIALLVGGLWLNRQKTQLMEAAASNRASGNYETAVANLEQVIADYSDSEEAAEARSTIPQVKLEWAASLREQGEYQAALNKYEELGDDAAVARTRSEGEWATYLAWGQALLTEARFAEAIKRLERVVAEAPAGSELANQAHELIPSGYLGVADTALAAGDVQGAFSAYDTIFANYATGNGREQALTSFATHMAAPLATFAAEQMRASQFAEAVAAYEGLVAYAPATSQAAEAEAQLPSAYYSWARQLADTGDYETAIAKYEYLLATFPNSSFQSKAEKGLIDAQVAAVNASGTAGNLPSPRSSGGVTTGDDTALYIVENDTVCPILLLASGPSSQSLAIPAGQTIEADFEPGTYDVVVQTDDNYELTADCQDIIPFTGEYIFEEGYEYNSSFYIE